MVVGTEGSRVYHLDASQHVIELAWLNGWHFSDLTLAAQAGLAAPGSPFAAYTMPSGTENHPRVHYLDGSGNIDQIGWDGQAWHFQNLSIATGGVAASDSPLAGFPMASGNATLFYVGKDRHVRELFWNGSHWLPTSDVSNLSNVPVAVAAGSPLAAFSAYTGTLQRVYFQGVDGHVYELYSKPDSTWDYRDVTGLTGAPAALPGTGMAALALGDNDELSRVYFVGTDQHVHELWWDLQNWHVGDLSQLTGAGDVSSTTSLTACAVSQVYPHVYYEASGGAVRELWYWSEGQQWVSVDPIAESGAPAPDTNTALTGFAVGGIPGYPLYPRTYYVDSGEVHELWFDGSTWGHVDVTDTAQ
jgi:hypothetical protein